MQFLYNENREVVAEKDYSGNIIRYIRGLGLISSDSENAKTYYHYVCDEQGSVSRIIRGEDKENGVAAQDNVSDRVLNHYEYDAFGNTISCEERVANRFRYQGEQYDSITRQYYLRAHYYNPVIGRFIQEDTYYGDGLNLYEYCRNNTITYKDPTGHNICATQRDLYHKYREEGMNPQEAYRKMRKDLGLDSKSGYKDSGVGNGNDPWRSYESGSKANLLDDTGKFIDDTLENNYQAYIKRKISKGQTPKDRLEWKQASEYWTKESPVARGNNFNKTVREADIYDYYEIFLENGKRLDSYDPDAGEIISRKATDLDKISEETYRRYLSEFSSKYSEGTKIRSNAYPELDGQELRGQYILEIPASNANLSNIDYYEKIASEYDVILRFTEEVQ